MKPGVVMEIVDGPDVLTSEQIAEIEALSARVPDGPWFTAADDADDVPGHRRSGLALVETGRSADWWIARLCEWHIAEFIAQSRGNIDALCATVKSQHSELEELRRCNSTQLENILHLQGQMKVMKEAIEAALPWLDTEIESHKCVTHDQPSHCVDCHLRHKAEAIAKQLRAAITPKGEQK